MHLQHWVFLCSVAHLTNNLEWQCHAAPGQGVFEAVQRPITEAITEDRTAEGAGSGKEPEAATWFSWLV